MPLASAGVWFDSDTGALPVSIRRRPLSAGGILPPLAVTAGLPFGWPDTSVAIRRRPWVPAQDSPAVPTMPPGFIAEVSMEAIVSQASEKAIRRQLWRPATDEPARPPYLQLPQDRIIDFASGDRARGSRRLWRPAETTDQTSAWAWGVGQPIPPLAWGTHDGSLRRRSQVPFRPIQETALTHVPGFASDVGVVFLGWRNDTPEPRRRRPAFHAQEVDSLPLPAWIVEVHHWQTAALLPQPELIRAPRWKAAAPSPDSTAPLFQAFVIATGLGLVAWDMPQPRIVYRQQRAWNDPGAWPVLDATCGPVPWLPVDDGSRQVARPAVRWNAPADVLQGTWQAMPSLIAIAGPYYVCAAQMWQPGAIEAQIETAD